MALKWQDVVIDAHDPVKLGRWWAEALDWKVTYESDGAVMLAKDEETYPQIAIAAVPDKKMAKNRLHLDLTPDNQAAEVQRLIDMGATKADIGQGQVSWVVLADPEGNEFCVLSDK